MPCVPVPSLLVCDAEARSRGLAGWEGDRVELVDSRLCARAREEGVGGTRKRWTPVAKVGVGGAAAKEGCRGVDWECVRRGERES